MKNLRHGVVLEEEVVDEQAGDEDDGLRLHENSGYLTLNTVKQDDKLTSLDRRILRKCDGESVELGGQVLDGARQPRPLAGDHADLLAVLFAPSIHRDAISN